MNQKQNLELKIGFLELWGIRFVLNYLKKNNSSLKFHDPENIDLENIYQPIRKYIFSVVSYSFLIGFLTTLAILAIDLFLPQSPALFSKQFYAKWIITLCSLILFTGLEFYLLYLVGFIYLAKITSYMEILVIDDPLLVTNNKNILARLILEIPDHRLNILNIDPFRFVNKHGLLLQTLLYKLKVFLSSFIAKLVIRKILARSSLRLYADFIIAPITAIWDGVVAYIIFQEVKQRLFARKLSEEFLTNIIQIQDSIDDELKDLSLRAIANTIVLNQKFHPNLEYLLLKTHELFKDSIRQDIVLDDWEYFISSLSVQSDQSIKLLSLIFNFCCALDGKISRLERRVINESQILSNPENQLQMEEIRSYIQQGNYLAARKYISLNVLSFKNLDPLWS
ncbi:MAG: hypothetical protein O9346_03740 [Leptospiraceae bacterium]|nr:hypothetical protein [Leptospiraceae bacterium]MCZ8345507.1 hypothetical protein [Leptospiraceae bacterium]